MMNSHEYKLFHRDLKPENILLDSMGHIKLCDFGFAMKMGKDDYLRDGCGTAMYIAPEIAGGHMKQPHSFPVDWWSLGCVLYEMIYGKSYNIFLLYCHIVMESIGIAPFGDTDSMSKFEIFNNINQKNPKFSLFSNSQIIEIINGLLEKNPQHRSNWHRVKESSWLADVNWNEFEKMQVIPPWIPQTTSIMDTK